MRLSEEIRKDKKRINDRFKNKRICKCGHSVYIPSSFRRIMCDWCGHWVYKDSKEEFKDKLLIKMKEKSNE